MFEFVLFLFFSVTIVSLFVSGLDDLFMNIMFWFYRGKYKKSLPPFSVINSKPQYPIAIMIGAWREHRVIGRTLRIALKKIKYTNHMTQHCQILIFGTPKSAVLANRAANLPCLISLVSHVSIVLSLPCLMSGLSYLSPV